MPMSIVLSEVIKSLTRRLLSLAFTMSALSAAVNYHAAALAWVAYDCALTFSDEVKYIWKRPVRSGTFIYLWVRYYGLATLAYNLAVTATAAMAPEPLYTYPNPSGLHVYRAVGELLGLIMIISVLVIGQARVYTMYMSKPLGIFNVGMWIVASTLSLAVWAMKHPLSCPESAREASVGCEEKYPFFYWVPITAYHAWLAGLAICKYVQRFNAFKLEHHGPDIVGLFFKDTAVQYASIIIVIITINVVHYQTSMHGDPMLIEANAVIVASRLVLHLRKAFYKQQIRSQDPHSTIRFHRQRAMQRSVLADESFWGDDIVGPSGCTDGT